MRINEYADTELEKQNIYNFYGINRTRKCSKGEMEDMLNMSSREYPCASPRLGRKKIAEAENIVVACAPDETTVSEVTGITGIADGSFYYNGEVKSGKFILRPEWAWSIERMGNLYIINGYNADKKKSEMYYYNIDTDEFSEGGTVMSGLIVTSGPNYLRTIHYDDDYSKIYNYKVTLSDGTVINNSEFYKKYALSSGTMSTGNNIFEQYFKVGDEVTIEGFPTASENEGQLWYYMSGNIHKPLSKGAGYNNTVDTDNMATTKNVDKYSICTAYVKSFSIRNMSSGKYAHEIYFDLYNKDGEAVEFDELTSQPNYCSGVRISKRKRALTNIAIHQGRIWGTAPTGNRLYASSSDDIFSFSSEDILNKYAVRLNSDTPGTFTGLCSYNNDLIAFKNHSIEIVSGTNPNNYSLSVIPGIGCIDGKSIATTPDGVIFLAGRGFYLYNGARTLNISEKLNTAYMSAVAAFDGDIYYAASKKRDGERELVKFDTNKNIWLKDDDFPATSLFSFKDDMYISSRKELYICNDEQTSDNVEWEMKSTIMRDYTLDNKSICEMWVLAELSENSCLKVSTITDSGECVLHSVFNKKGINLFRCPVRNEPCTSYQYKLSGFGNVVIHEIEIKLAEGTGRRHKEMPETHTPEFSPERGLITY